MLTGGIKAWFLGGQGDPVWAASSSLLLAGEEAPPERPPTVPYRKPGNCVVSLPVSMLVSLENSETGH